MAYHHGKFVWFEHMSRDVDKAQAFYSALFGWSCTPVPMGGDAPYPMIQNGGEGIGGFRSAGPTAPTHWISYLSVADVDASFKTIQAMGNRTMMEPSSMGPGRAAAVTDPQGASFALWRSADGDRADAPATPVGGWHWNELWTSDADGAIAFYEKTFGFTTEPMALPDGRRYFILQAEGVPRAGLMQSPDPTIKPMWLPYVAVADCDASIAQAAALGGKLAYPAMELAGVGRFAVLGDPCGAVIGVIKPG